MKFGWALDHHVPDSVERQLVQAADTEGIDSVWTMENHHLRDGVTTAAVTLERTRKVRVVMGTLSPFFRHPVEIGLTLANLVRMYPGRCAVNLGQGMPETLERLGISVAHPQSRLRETIQIIQLLFKGESFAFAGEHFHIEKHRLSGDPLELPPIFIGAMGPRLIHLAGEIADGVNLPLASSPEYIAESVNQFLEGAKAGGRDRSRLTIASEVLVQVCDHGDELAGVRRLLGFHFSSKYFEKVAAPAGMDLDHAAIKEAFLSRSPDELRKVITDEIVHTFSAVGSPTEILARLHQYWDCGLDLIILYTAGTGEQRLRTMHELIAAARKEGVMVASA
jgi:5,10-methylenetetrahydromethanopterin reductase